MKFKTSRLVVSLILSGIMAASMSGSPIVGEGYIHMTGIATPEPNPPAAAGRKFIWSPQSNYFFVGYTEANRYFGHNFVTLMGETSNEGAVAIIGSAEENSVAIGIGSRASYYAVAIGRASRSLGGYSIAIGSMNDDANFQATATSMGAIAIGSFSEATGTWSTAIGGVNASALGDFSNAVGPYTYALGDHSTALGYRTSAIGDRSLAAGWNAKVFAYRGVGLGSYNKGNVRRDGVTVNSSTAHAEDPLLTVGNGTDSQSSDAFTLYRDGVARFEGAVQIKAGAGYLTIQPGGTTNRTLTLPDTDGALLATTSTLDAAKLSGIVPSTSLPTAATQLGATVELDSGETTGNLPWSRVAGKPATLSGYGITDGLAVQRNAAGRITTALHIEPQGDIPMFVASPP